MILARPYLHYVAFLLCVLASLVLATCFDSASHLLWEHSDYRPEPDSSEEEGENACGFGVTSSDDLAHFTIDSTDDDDRGRR